MKYFPNTTEPFFISQAQNSLLVPSRVHHGFSEHKQKNTIQYSSRAAEIKRNTVIYEESGRMMIVLGDKSWEL